MGPPTKFSGPAGGSPAAQGGPEISSLPKNVQKSRFLDKTRPGERGTNFDVDF